MVLLLQVHNFVFCIACGDGVYWGINQGLSLGWSILVLDQDTYLQNPNTKFQYWDMSYQMTYHVLAHMPYFRRPGHI